MKQPDCIGRLPSMQMRPSNHCRLEYFVTSAIMQAAWWSPSNIRTAMPLVFDVIREKVGMRERLM